MSESVNCSKCGHDTFVHDPYRIGSINDYKIDGTNPVQNIKYVKCSKCEYPLENPVVFTPEDLVQITFYTKPKIMSKEDIKNTIRKLIKSGFQHDYDRMDNLIPVFQEQEVVDNIVIELDECAKNQSILFQQFVEDNYHPFMATGLYMDKYKFEKGTPWPDLEKVTKYTLDKLYSLFLIYQSKQKDE